MIENKHLLLDIYITIYKVLHKILFWKLKNELRAWILTIFDKYGFHQRSHPKAGIRRRDVGGSEKVWPAEPSPFFVRERQKAFRRCLSAPAWP